MLKSEQHFTKGDEKVSEKITLNEVAQAAGVSPATASLALSGKGRLSDYTRQSVLEVADSLGYHRKRRPAQLATESRKTVGILMSVDYEWAFVWNLVQPIVDQILVSLHDEGYTAVLIPIRGQEPTDAILDRVDRAGVEAVVPVHYGNHILFIRLEERGIPVVVVMNNNYQTKYYSVCVDDYQGAYEGCSYLLGLGHRDIAYIDGNRNELPALSHDRLFGFRKALDEQGVPFREERQATVDINDFGMIMDTVKRIFVDAPPPSALFALDDDLAVRVMHALNQFGLQVPEDVSVIAPGDVLDYNMPHIPKITTMRINTNLTGEISAELLLNRIKHTREDVHVLKVNQHLVERGSCRQV
jgi:LacI family transcriptional regulator